MTPRFTHTIDPDALADIAPRLKQRPLAEREELARAIGTALHRFQPGIGQRAAAHFTGQCAHETGEFRWLREIWGPTPAQAGYWRRRDLQGPGLLLPWLGKAFRGGGMIQTTGRANYRRAARRLGRRSALRLAQQAGQPRVAALLAAIWWADHFPPRMRGFPVAQVTRTVNGGTTGLDERRAYTARAMRVRRKLTPRPIGDHR